MRFWRRRANEVDEEIATHIAMSIADRITQGESPEEARRAAGGEVRTIRHPGSDYR